MADCCPTCGRALAAEADDVNPVALMRAACAVMGIALSWDDHVSERDAARLLNRSPSTLRNRRGLDCPIPFRKRGGRVEYALMDLCDRGEKIA